MNNDRSLAFLDHFGLRERFYIGPIGLLIVLTILSSIFIYVGNAHQQIWQEVSQHYNDIGKDTDATIERFHNLHERIIHTILSADKGVTEEEIYDQGIEIIDQIEITHDQLNLILKDATSLVDKHDLDKLSLAIDDMNKAISDYDITIRKAVEMATVNLDKVASLSLVAVEGHIKVNSTLNIIRSLVFSSIQSSMNSRLAKYNKLYAKTWIGLLLFTFVLIYISFRISKLTINTLEYIHNSLLHTANLVSNNETTQDYTTPSPSFKQVESAVDTFSKVVMELEQQRQQIQYEQQKALAASNAKSVFLSSMSHEFRTPLNQVLGYIQLLENTEINKEQQVCSQNIAEGGKKLLLLVEKILLLTNLEARQLDAEIEKVNIKYLLNDCLENVAEQVKLQSINISVSDLNDFPDIAVSSQLASEVLIAILSNAISYNKANGSVDIVAEVKNNDYLVITITDTGSGIAEQDYDRIYEPFERLSISNSNISGAGVGLTIAKNITEAMGGNIGFSSKLGVGSSFWVEFPLAN
jgi:signal transduction histidine kinase